MSNRIKPAQPTPVESSNRDTGFWVAGIFYVNPGNPRLLIPKRVGGGWTFNFAHPIAWVLTAGVLFLIGLIIAAALLLPHVLR